MRGDAQPLPLTEEAADLDEGSSPEQIAPNLLKLFILAAVFKISVVFTLLFYN